MGYQQSDTFTVSVVSANTQAHGAVLTVPGILGAGAKFSVGLDTKAGAVKTIKVTDSGEDYVSAPSVSLKVQDILVSNVSSSNLPSGNYICGYQFTRYLAGSPSNHLIIKDVSPSKTEIKLIPSGQTTHEYNAYCVGKGLASTFEFGFFSEDIKVLAFQDTVEIGKLPADC